MNTSFGNCCGGFLHNYIDETLLHVKNLTSTQRLERFTRQNPVPAEFIWKGNLATREQQSRR